MFYCSSLKCWHWFVFFTNTTTTTTWLDLYIYKETFWQRRGGLWCFQVYNQGWWWNRRKKGLSSSCVWDVWHCSYILELHQCTGLEKLVSRYHQRFLAIVKSVINRYHAVWSRVIDGVIVTLVSSPIAWPEAQQVVLHKRHVLGKLTKKVYMFAELEHVLRSFTILFPSYFYVTLYVYRKIYQHHIVSSSKGW